jgi:predicted ABC-type transport system involved in lysophospholipase L1 biosynthesis ATPase subunit
MTRSNKKPKTYLVVRNSVWLSLEQSSTSQVLYSQMSQQVTLDSTTGEKIEDLLFSFNKKIGSTLVIVTHDADLAAKCDMQVEMKDGKVTRVTKTKPQTQTPTRRKVI